MLEILFSRTTVIGLAIIGGIFSIISSWCQKRALTSEQNIVWLTRASYAFMAVSIILFVGAGLFGEE
ncbi:MAG: hypothetical protein ACI9KN_001100 [Gammaproteobacteria bacterium]|jgi:hypothetical protein